MDRSAAIADIRHCIAVASQSQPDWREVWEDALKALTEAPTEADTSLQKVQTTPPDMEAVAWREKVARIIDPDGWNTRDRQNREIDKNPASGFMTEADAERARPSTGMYSRRSLAKADAILQALAVIPSPASSTTPPSA